MNILAERLKSTTLSATVGLTKVAQDLQSKGKDIILLSAGEPDFDTPNHIRDAAKTAIDNGYTKYSPLDGLPELKAAVQRKFHRENGLDYSHDAITVGAGVKQVIFNAFLATINPGDKVIFPAPYWVSYLDITRLCGGIPQVLATDRSTGFKMTAVQLAQAISSETKWVVLNSPNNPSGATYSEQELKNFVEVLRLHPHVHVLCDDIYEHIVYDASMPRHLGALAPDLKERILVVNGVSKSYAMTGWRIGYAGGPSTIIQAMNVIQSRSITAPSSISQMAAVAALDGNCEFRLHWLKSYVERRNHVVSKINAIPDLSCDFPSGAFYCFASCENVIGKRTSEGVIISCDRVFSRELLKNEGVAVIPGSAFGIKNYFRVSYSVSIKSIEEGCSRISRFCESLI